MPSLPIVVIFPITSFSSYCFSCDFAEGNDNNLDLHSSQYGGEPK